jgi:hypothetical protein
MRFEGEIAVESGEFGYDAKLLGRAAWDAKAGRFASFDLVSVGTRKGAVHHSGRGPWGGTPPDRGPAPMGVACVLAR